MPGTFAARVPDSKVAHEATELARQDCSPSIFNHCMRTFWFADAIAGDGLRLDREVLYIAAVLHDLGLTERHDRGQRFEVDGAEAARDFLSGRAYPGEKVDLVWSAIALHTSPGIADRSAPEVALVRLGAAADVAGARIPDFDPGFVRGLIETFPRLDFSTEFLRLIVEQVRNKPAAACFTFMVDVGRQHVPGFACPSLADSLANNPLDEL
ncbi:MAG: HD domain-containing protein [Egibacteraceae bacterium]